VPSAVPLGARLASANPIPLPSRAASAASPRTPSSNPDVTAHARYRGGGGGYGGGGGGYSSAPSPIDRLIAAVPWLLPLLDAFSYGRFLFYQFPLAARLVSPLAPLVSLYASIPFAPLVCFFGLYLGVVNNPQVSRFARFSAMQAVLVDILLVLPRLLESLASPPAQGWGLKAYITAQNSIWVLVAAVVAYGVGCAVLGKTARVPFVADAADAQIMR
jgi:uncharacterized membrane protein